MTLDNILFLITDVSLSSTVHDFMLLNFFHTPKKIILCFRTKVFQKNVQLILNLNIILTISKVRSVLQGKKKYVRGNIFGTYSSTWLWLSANNTELCGPHAVIPLHISPFVVNILSKTISVRPFLWVAF